MIARLRWRRPGWLRYARPRLAPAQSSYDPWLLLSAGSLLLLGWVMVSSASVEVANVNYGNPFYHSVRHLVYLLLGLGAAALTLLIPVRWWQQSGWWLLLLAFALLVLVLIPGIGREVNGSIRWIRLGPINVQPSELAKLCVIIYLAGYLVRRQDEVRSRWSGFLKPLYVMAPLTFLLLLEPDFGAVVVMMGAVLGMMFLAGVRASQFFVVVIGSLAVVALMAVSQPYRMQRLTTFTDPWADQFASGYQLTQSLIAFGRGEWFGVGLGNSVQKLFYLPEAHTDFVFAVIAEELGLVGAVVVLLLFSTLVYRVLLIGRRAETAGRFFSAYAAYGIGLQLGGQILINIGVNTGLLPTKGLTLPLLSYGGSSLVVICATLALLLRIDYETRRACLQEPAAADVDEEQNVQADKELA